MDNRKIVFNNEQYSILTNIKIGSSTFLICIDAFDKKVVYFKQEAVDGKVKLIASANLVTTASDVTKKSMSNKKRMMDAFCTKISEILKSCVFVDRTKVTSSFKSFTRDIDACDLKYYIIDNASIEPSDESIQNVVEKYNDLDVKKDLEQENLAQNELYYFSNEVDEPVKPKENIVENSNNLNLTQELKNDETNNYDTISETSGLIQNDEHLFDNVDEMMKNTTANIPVPEVEPVVYVSEEDLKKRKKKNIIIISITLVLLAGFLAGYFLFFNKKEEKKTNKSIVNRLLKIVEIEEDAGGIAYNKPQKTTENYLYYMDQKMINIDFDALEKENEDTVAWIKMDTIGINYPVVKSTDNYYTKNDYDKESSSDGWIYVKEDTDFSKLAYNIVIYGASASDGSLFGALKRTLEDDWYRDYNNYYFNLSTKYSNTMWQIASAYEIEKDELEIETEFDTKDEFLKYYSNVVKSSNNTFSVVPNENDKIITLVTDKDDTKKLVVVAKLIKINEKEQPEIIEEKKDETSSEKEEIKTNEAKKGDSE